MRLFTDRRAFVNFASISLLAALGLVVALAIGWFVWISSSSGQTSLTVYCAAGMRAPVENLARDYEKAYGVKVHVQYGGSQTLLANIEVSKRGDLYVPGDDYYIRLAQDKKMLDEVIPLAEMTPVIAVAKGNPKNIRSLEQLLTNQVRISQANPDAAAVGRLTREALPAAQWELLKKNTTVFKLTVNDVANDVTVGAVDAGIVWDATIAQYPGLEKVACPELGKKKARVCVAVLKTCEQPADALRFARFLAARDKGLLEFKNSGFEPVEGDAWAERPELNLFAGAMLRPAIEKTIIAFEEREGVKVTRVYNGCGILVGQMKTGSRPDAYFACEKSFMKQVSDLFLEPIDLSSNNLVIVVRKGNPHGIKNLSDLTRPGLRIGVGHEQQCALGAITQKTFAQAKLNTDAMKNVVRSPSGDMLINQLRTGSLDAVIAYISNTADANDIEALSLEKELNLTCAVAVQPWAVGKASKYKQLSGRLLAAIRSQESRDRFISYGFVWKDKLGE